MWVSRYERSGCCARSAIKCAAAAAACAEQNILFLDRDLPPAGRLEVLLEELSRRDLGEVYVSPELRRILGKDERSGAENP